MKSIPNNRECGRWGYHWQGQVSAHVLKGEAEVAIGSCSSGLKQAGGGTGVSPTNLPRMESCAPPTSAKLLLHKWGPNSTSGQEEDGFPVGTGKCAHH